MTADPFLCCPLRAFGCSDRSSDVAAFRKVCMRMIVRTPIARCLQNGKRINFLRTDLLSSLLLNE